MCSSARSLPALEVAIRRRGATLAWAQLVRVHPQAHRATRGTPLEPGILEDQVETFRLGLGAHAHRTGYDQCPDSRLNLTTGNHRRREPQVLDAAVRARSNEHGV